VLALLDLLERLSLLGPHGPAAQPGFASGPAGVEKRGSGLQDHLALRRVPHLFLLSSILLAGLGVDFTTAFTAVASALGNIGPGFGMVGPVENYADIPFPGK
jgi:hypothetical protein